MNRKSSTWTKNWKPSNVVKQSFAAKEEEIKRQKAEVAKLNEERIQELERISGLTSEQAKEYLLKTVEEDVKHGHCKVDQGNGASRQKKRLERKQKNTL